MQKLKNNEARPKFTGSYKKCVYVCSCGMGYFSLNSRIVHDPWLKYLQVTINCFATMSPGKTYKKIDINLEKKRNQKPSPRN